MPDKFRASTLRTPIMVGVLGLLILSLSMLWLLWRVRSDTWSIRGGLNRNTTAIHRLEVEENEHADEVRAWKQGAQIK